MSRRGVVGGRVVPVAAWAGLTVLVIATSFLSNRVLRDPDWSVWRGTGFLVDGLLQYDGHNYLRIATEGYTYRQGTRSSIVWFPLYPLLIRAADDLVHPPVVAGVLVTAGSALVALLLYWQWLGRHGLAGAARATAFAALALYPYSWFLYGVVYADATFLACALAAVLLVERGHPLLGGLAGALATAARPTGMALVPALLALAAAQQGALGAWAPRPTTPAGRVRRLVRWVADWVRWPRTADPAGLARALPAPLLALCGVTAYALYLWRAFGDPLIFLTNQETFHGRYPYLKLTFASRIVFFHQQPILSATIILQFAFGVATLAAAGAVARRFGFAYAVLVVAAVGIPAIGTHDFMGTGRYLLLAFPAFALAGERLAARPRLARRVLGASGLLMLVMAFGFSRSAYLS